MKQSAHHACPVVAEQTKKTNNPDHTSALARLRKIQGQILGIQKMIEDQRYCPDILVQFQAVEAGLRSVAAPIFERHLRHCVNDAFESKEKSEIDSKIDELVRLFNKH